MVSNIISKFSNLSEKNNILFKNVLGTFAVKGVALLLSLFMMPAYISFFNNQTVLGLWFTILSVLNWVLNCDFGIGNGLRNYLTKTITLKKYEEAKEYISSAYISIGLVVIFFVFLFSILFNHISWNQILNIDPNVVSPGALLTSIKIVFIGIVLQFFFNIITYVIYALQKAYINNLLTLCTSIIIFIAIIILPSNDNDVNIVVMAIVNLLAVLFPLLVATIIIFSRTRIKKMAPSFSSFKKLRAKRILSLGGVFFYVQFVYLVIMGTNDYLITLFTNNANVVEYQVYKKLFTFGSTLFVLSLAPIWSAVTKAMAENDYVWIRVLYKRLLWLACAGVLLEILIIPFLQIIIDFWIGDNIIEVNVWYAIIFAISGSIMIFNVVLSSIANGLGELKTQVVFFSIGALLKIPLSYLLVIIMHSWIGVVVANILSMLLYCCIQPYWLRRELNFRMNKI